MEGESLFKCIYNRRIAVCCLRYLIGEVHLAVHTVYWNNTANTEYTVRSSLYCEIIHSVLIKQGDLSHFRWLWYIHCSEVVLYVFLSVKGLHELSRLLPC